MIGKLLCAQKRPELVYEEKDNIFDMFLRCPLLVPKIFCMCFHSRTTKVIFGISLHTDKNNNSHSIT